MDENAYLIWSHEHGAWWGPGENGYVRRLSEAGRYTHAEALRICAEAIPGTAQQIGALPELPVLEADVLMLRGRFHGSLPGLPQEQWE